MEKKKVWYMDLEDDSLEIMASEIEDLENDELSIGEAGFMEGYATEAEEEFYGLAFEAEA